MTILRSGRGMATPKRQTRKRELGFITSRVKSLSEKLESTKMNQSRRRVNTVGEEKSGVESRKGE